MRDKILIISLIIVYGILFLTLLFPNFYYFFFILIFLNLITAILFLIKKSFLQKRKDKFIRNKFNNSAFLVLPRLYTRVKWDKMSYCLKKIEGTTESLPWFLRELVNLEEFKITKWHFKGKYQRKKPHTFPKIFIPYFKIEKFKYIIRVYEFHNINRPEIRFSVIILTIQEFSFISFAIERQLNYNDLINYGSKSIFFKATRLPLFPISIYTHRDEISSEAVAYNPFLIINFGLNLSEQEFIKFKNDIETIYFHSEAIKNKFFKIDWLLDLELNFFSFKITGEWVFLNGLIKEWFEFQMQPMIKFQMHNILIDETPTTKLARFFDIFDEYEYYIEDLNPQEFVDLKKYLRNGIDSLGTTFVSYSLFGKFLRIDYHRFKLFSRFLVGLYDLKQKFNLILDNIEQHKIKPKKDKKLYIKTGFPHYDEIIYGILSKKGFWKELNPNSSDSNIWLELISYFGKLLHISYDVEGFLRIPAQTWTDEVRDMQPWVTEELIRGFGSKLKDGALVSGGHSDHWINDIPIEDKLLRTEEGLNNDKIIKEKYQKHKEQILREAGKCSYGLLLIVDIREEIKNNMTPAFPLKNCLKIFIENDIWIAVYLFQAFTSTPSKL